MEWSFKEKTAAHLVGGAAKTVSNTGALISGPYTSHCQKKPSRQALEGFFYLYTRHESYAPDGPEPCIPSISRGKSCFPIRGGFMDGRRVLSIFL